MSSPSSLPRARGGNVHDSIGPNSCSIVPSFFTHCRRTLSVACLLALMAVAADGRRRQRSPARRWTSSALVCRGPRSPSGWPDLTSNHDGQRRHLYIRERGGGAVSSSGHRHRLRAGDIRSGLRGRRRPCERQRHSAGGSAAAGRVVVTAAADELLQSQTGAPVTVIDRHARAMNKPDVLEALRLMPGAKSSRPERAAARRRCSCAAATPTSPRCSSTAFQPTTSAAESIFSQLQTTGVGRIEVMRQANSVIYGSDALTGVVNIETRRGRTRIPELAYTLDGGNLGTLHNDSIRRRGRTLRLLLRLLVLRHRQRCAEQRLPQPHLRRAGSAPCSVTAPT